MRMCRRVVTVLALSLPLAAWAEVPVVDDNAGSYPPAGYGTSGAYAGAGASTPASAQGQLFMQLQQMQDQLSRQQGIIEELQNDVSRMKQENLERYQDLIDRMARLEYSTSANEAPKGSVTFVLDGATVALPLQGVVDLPAEAARLAKEIAKLIEESVQQVTNGAQVSKDAARSFEGIMSSVGRTGTSVSAIASAADQQRQRASEVTTVINGLVGDAA